MIIGKFPNLRLRRSRKNDWSRRLIEENNLTPNDFILPIFLIDGKNKKIPIKSMPGVYRYTLDRLNSIVDIAIKSKLPMIALFPLIESGSPGIWVNDIAPKLETPSTPLKLFILSISL